MKRQLINQKFGKLEVLNLGCPDPKTRNRRWVCRCDCGMTELVWESSLISGHKKSCGCLHRYREGIAARNQVFNSYQRGALKRGQVWSLSPEDFDGLVQRQCFYCGETPSNLSKSKTGHFVYNGIDRIDNTDGYSLENCVACCKICNYMKRTLGIEAFLEHVRKIARYARLPRARNWSPIRTADFGVADITKMPGPKPGQGAKI